MMLPTESVDTRHLPPADRWPYWLEVTGRAVAPLAMTTEHAADFQGGARLIDLGGVQLTRFHYQSLTGRRTPKLIRQADPGIYQLALTLTGSSGISAARRHTMVGRDAFTLLDYGRPHQLFHHADQGGLAPAASATVVVPRSLLPLPANKIDRLAAGRLSGTEGMGALLAQHLNQLTRHPEQYAASEAPRLAGLTLDLVSALLARQLDLEAALPVDVRQQATLAQVRAFIDRHLGDPMLTPQTVADAHHVSLRSLHRLFAEEPDTVAQLIRRRRLERCRRDLADPRLRNRPVQAIGWRWGFTDKAHFSRAFRAAYGMSPRSYRAAHELARTVNPVARSDNRPPAYWPLTG
ncbi:AraC-type DNA-binding protein [Micromonospora pallida]|uniref:AraC-type DNA-binding protein n=1 Tax=Micromonospora pallida TaxID=145854 RepID=A0A1C6SNZ6_9ACTN|nr:helix-turn-helix domain-containing protein [Micromonospora pallida]SCL31112.1 AraC-type DNA-binding protein [Micromonospora pallida]